MSPERVRCRLHRCRARVGCLSTLKTGTSSNKRGGTISSMAHGRVQGSVDVGCSGAGKHVRIGAKTVPNSPKIGRRWPYRLADRVLLFRSDSHDLPGRRRRESGSGSGGDGVSARSQHGRSTVTARRQQGDSTRTAPGHSTTTRPPARSQGPPPDQTSPPRAP